MELARSLPQAGEYVAFSDLTNFVRIANNGTFL